MGESGDDTAKAGAGGANGGSEACECKRRDGVGVGFGFSGDWTNERVEYGGEAGGGGWGRAHVGGGPAGITKLGISRGGPHVNGRGGRAG